MRWERLGACETYDFSPSCIAGRRGRRRPLRGRVRQPSPSPSECLVPATFPSRPSALVAGDVSEPRVQPDAFSQDPVAQVETPTSTGSPDFVAPRCSTGHASSSAACREEAAGPPRIVTRRLGMRLHPDALRSPRDGICHATQPPHVEACRPQAWLSPWRDALHCPDGRFRAVLSHVS